MAGPMAEQSWADCAMVQGQTHAADARPLPVGFKQVDERWCKLVAEAWLKGPPKPPCNLLPAARMLEVAALACPAPRTSRCVAEKSG